MIQIDGTVFVELKKKYKGVVYKRRVDMKLYEAENYLYEKHSVKKKNQITNSKKSINVLYCISVNKYFFSYRLNVS